jgi:ketose-bisphosphate aldolase
MFVNPKELLIDARRKGYALGHFNVFNIEMAKAVINAIVRKEKPAFVAITETTIKYLNLPVAGIANFVRDITKVSNAEKLVILHLDHGKNLKIIKEALEAGFSSVMIDGSAFHFEENTDITKKVVDLAHTKGVAVEAEMGHVGRVGEIISKGYYTKPSRAEEFVELTGVDSLAVAVGTIHGLVTEMNIDFERLKKISSLVKIPLVIHGGTGLKNKDIIGLIREGASKINIDTALRIAFMRGMKQNITEADPRKVLTAGMDEVQIVVENYIDIFSKGGH